MKLLLVGGGHASISVLKRARKWSGKGIEITLLNDHPYLYYSGMMPENLGGVYARDEVRVDLRAWCQHAGIRWVEGRATSLNLERKSITTADGVTLRGDIVAFNIGAVNPGGCDERHVPTKPLHKMERLASRIEKADRLGTGLDILIAGGGAAGTEIALNVSARLPKAAIIVVEQSSRLLPGFPDGMGRCAARMLTDRGVRLMLDATVSDVQDGKVELNSDEAVRTDEVIWATGSHGPPLFQEAGLSCTQEGFVRVDQTLSHPDHPWLFVAGDSAAVNGYEELQRIGVHAVKQGPLLAHNLASRLFEDRELQSFTPYPVAPLILSTGSEEALWSVGRLWIRGKPILRLKHLVDINWMDRARRPGSKRRPLIERIHARHALQD